MLEVATRGREQLTGVCVCWALLEQADEDAGSLPDPGAALPQRDPDRLSKEPVARAYRDLFWRFDIDPTKKRPAGEALARRLAQGKGLPRIHPLVDAYNLASAATLVPLSAFDADALTGGIVLDVSEDGERFDPIGGEPTNLAAGRPVFRDGEGVVSLLGYRDAERTALDDGTERALVLGVGPAAVGPRVMPEAFRMLENYASVVGWNFTSGPNELEV